VLRAIVPKAVDGPNGARFSGPEVFEGGIGGWQAAGTAADVGPQLSRGIVFPTRIALMSSRARDGVSVEHREGHERSKSLFLCIGQNRPFTVHSIRKRWTQWAVRVAGDNL